MAGYLVDYERVPITDEKSPKEMDFDILVSIFVCICYALSHLVSLSAYIFCWCNQGVG